MDGYALRRADFDRHPSQPFRLIGRSLAGHPFAGAVSKGECVRVFTGAVVPKGADQVILQEQVNHSPGATSENENAPATSDPVVTFHQHQPGERYVRAVGHDITRGSVVAGTGTRVTALLFGALQSYGVNQVQVLEPLKVGVFSTGDELVEPTVPAEDLQPGQIYDSNRATVLALLDDPLLRTFDFGCVPDNLQQTRSMLSQASQQVDVLITSGGVSVGDADFVTQVIQELGTLRVWKLNLKPGKPMAVGNIGNCTIFGLPGNPVSTVVTLLLIAKPLMFSMLGVNEPPAVKVQATLQTGISHQQGRTEFQRGTLTNGERGLEVSHTGDQSSNRLHSLATANCLIEIDQTFGDLAKGSIVTVMPFWGLLNR